MKIAITGNTRGIGKALNDGFVSQGHEVIGFSKSTPINLSTEVGLNKIVEACKDCDIFINNAYDVNRGNTTIGFAQTILLYRMWNLWKGQDKTIVVLGSKVADQPQIKTGPYPIQKKALDEAVKHLRFLDTRPHILNLRPGWVDTQAVANYDSVTKMDPRYIFEVCNWALIQPYQMLDITFAPKQ